jgi:PspAB-like protein
MGFLDALLGKRKIQGQAAKNRLFAMSTAPVGLEAQQGIVTRGAAGIVFQPLATGDFQAIVSDTEEVLRGTGAETGSTIETSDDSYGYRWMIIRDPDVEDLVVGVNAVGDSLELGGYGERVLAAVFAFQDAQARPVYFIYNFKRGLWYPFVPAGGEQQRDNERELQIKAAIGADLPFEPELERWFPLWGIPI